MAFYRYFQPLDALPDTSGRTPVCIISPAGQWGWHTEVSQVHVVCWSMPSASNMWGSNYQVCLTARPAGDFLAVLVDVVVLPQLKTKTDYMWSKEAWHWAGAYEYKIQIFLLEASQPAPFILKFVPTKLSHYRASLLMIIIMWLWAFPEPTVYTECIVPGCI